MDYTLYELWQVSCEEYYSNDEYSAEDCVDFE